MNYYEHHLGDYIRDTVHLSMLEDAAYRRLLDAYYTREAPLPLDAVQCCRLARASSKPERDAVSAVLAEFFRIEDDGYHQPRADAEIARFKLKQADADVKRDHEAERQRRHRDRRAELFDALREAGQVPAYNTTTNELEAMLSRVTNGSGHAPVTRDKQPTSRVRQRLPSNQTPVTNQEQEQEHESPNGDSSASAAADAPPTKSDPIPYGAIVETFNRTLTRLPKARTLTPKRRTLIRSAWQAAPERRSIEFWEALAAEYEADDFTNGTGPYLHGHEGWRPSIDYLLRADVVTRTFERAMHRMEQPA